ncbi:MAG: protein-disulfide reductase DsbD [Pseudomonadota bacterium]
MTLPSPRPRHWPLLLLAGLALLLVLAPAPALAQLKKIGPATQTSFLRAEEAFQLVPSRSADGLSLGFEVTPGYYLYRDRFGFSSDDAGLRLGTPVYSAPGEWKDDPTFGRVQVHHESLTVTLPASGSGLLRVRWQGCADAGLCYPPQEQWLQVDATGVTAVAPPPRPAAPPAASTGSDAGAGSRAGTTERSGASAALPALPGSDGGRAGQLLVIFLLGLTLSFTPCVLPMLPILAGIVARQHTSSAWRGLSLAFAYVLGVASVYALLGALVGLFGQQINLPGWFQQPVVLIVFAGLFFALALSLFGLFELRLPVAISSHFHGLSQRQRGGALAGSYVMGLFSALVVSPCVSAPLFGVLLHISSTGDAGFGALALFLLAMGMGVPLLVLGATEGRLLPTSGPWMHEVKTFFGLLLLFVGTELLTRLVPAPLALLLYGLCTAAVGVWLWRLLPARARLGLVSRAGAIAALAYAAALLAGAAAGGDDPLRPLAPFTSSGQAAQATPFIRIKSGADLDREIALAQQQGQVLMLDFYADWCVSCKVMERQVFRRPDVAARLARLRLVQADVTANDATDRALLQRFGLLGPPTLLFFGRDGRELVPARLVGEKDADGFIAHLDAHGL